MANQPTHNSTPNSGDFSTTARIVGVAIAAALIVAPSAHAAPDPHIPNPGANYCPGGSAGSPIYMGFCDGEHYPDGTYWHTRQWGIPIYGSPNGLAGTNGGPNGAECVIDNGSPLPPPAPPGGCGGAVS